MAIAAAIEFLLIGLLPRVAAANLSASIPTLFVALGSLRSIGLGLLPAGAMPEFG